MRSLRRFLVAAITSVAALAFWTAAVDAGCGEGEKGCTLAPPRSRQIAISTHVGEQTGSADPFSQPIQPLQISMPLPVRIDPGALSSTKNDFNETGVETIDVPLRPQSSSDVSCGVQALGMALEGLPGEAPTSDAILNFLSKNEYLYEFGTGVEELAMAAQSLGYEGSLAFHEWTLEKLRTELEAGRPVVINLGANGSEQPGHFVTLTGIAEDWSQVAYSDPILGERVVSLSEFMSLWNLQGNSGVIVAEAAPAARSAESAGWTALFTAMMATLALGPKVLADSRRRGVGGSRSVPLGSIQSQKMTVISKQEPAYTPPGKIWKRGKPIYEQRTETITVTEKVPNMVWKDVPVGTRTVTEKIPHYVTITVDQGHWATKMVKKSKWVTESAGYTYKKKRYPTPTGWKTTYQKVPKYKKVKKYYWKEKKYWVPDLVEKQVQQGYYIVEKEETVYEKQWVQDGWKEVSREKELTFNAPTGEYEWTLVDDPNYVPEPEEPLPVERTNMDWDPFRDNPGSNFPTKDDYLESLFQEEFQPTLMTATGNMHFRSEPSGDSEHLAWIATGEYFYYTGATITVNGTNWKSIAMLVDGEWVHGWVVDGYQEPVDPVELVVMDDSLEARNSTLEYYWYHLSAAERQALLEEARQQVDAFRAEIQRITSTLRPGDPLNDLLKEAADILLELPDWYEEAGIPSSYFGRSTLNPEAVEALQTLLSLADDIPAPPNEETWALAATVFGITEADLILHVLDGATWPTQESTSAGEFPINLFVTRLNGHYLYASPDPNSANVSDAFLGVPQGEAVAWNGTYHIGVDENGASCVYYQVEWTFNGVTYTGWIPGEHLAPEVEEVDPYTSLIYGDWPTTTFGYGDPNGWSAYYAGGAMQNLNLRLLFQEMGYPEEVYNQLPTSHHNLCGELAVMQALGISLQEGLSRFMELGDEFFDLLTDPDSGTNISNITTFIEAFSDNGWSAETQSIGLTEANLSIQQANNVLALVTIDTDPDMNGGVIGSGNTSHWVHIGAISDGLVTYYNPYTNVEETVNAETFEEAWESTPGNEGSFISVLAMN